MSDPEAPAGRRVRVLVVDDHGSFADALCMALRQDPRVERCESRREVEAAIELVATGGFDIVVMDALFAGSADGMDGVDGVRALRALDEDLRVVMLTGWPDAALLADAVDAGVDGFISKEASLADLRETVLGDEPVDLRSAELVAAITAQSCRFRVPGQPGPPPASRLTPREHEVLALLAEGTLVKDLAGQIGVTRETCRGYIKTLLVKLGARSQLHAVVIAARQGLLDGPEG